MSSVLAFAATRHAIGYGASMPQAAACQVRDEGDNTSRLRAALEAIAEKLKPRREFSEMTSPASRQ